MARTLDLKGRRFGRMKRLLPLLLALAACDRVPPVDAPPAPPLPPEVVEAVVADQPLPEAVEAVQTPILAAVEALEPLTPAAPPPEPRSAACRRAAAALIIRWEITSPAWYERRLRFPVWPGGASGVTWGVGYDGGHVTRATILDDWSLHGSRALLSESAGITGARARDALPKFRAVETPYDYAARVFEDRSLIEYERRTERAFRNGFEALCPYACAALTSTVYNRGAAMTGDSRREMRVTRDECVPAQDYACIARELRSMKRLWRGTVNENGLSARREDEALLALQCLSPAATGAGDG